MTTRSIKPGLRLSDTIRTALIEGFVAEHFSEASADLRNWGERIYFSVHDMAMADIQGVVNALTRSGMLPENPSLEMIEMALADVLNFTQTLTVHSSLGKFVIGGDTEAMKACPIPMVKGLFTPEKYLPTELWDEINDYVAAQKELNSKRDKAQGMVWGHLRKFKSIRELFLASPELVKHAPADIWAEGEDSAPATTLSQLLAG